MTQALHVPAVRAVLHEPGVHLDYWMILFVVQDLPPPLGRAGRRERLLRRLRHPEHADLAGSAARLQGGCSIHFHIVLGFIAQFYF